MRAAGIDIGSRFIKLAIVEEGGLVEFKMAESSFDPLGKCSELLKEAKAQKVIATGYGRHLLEIHTEMKTITEIKAFARGARAFFPNCRTIVDIGGQDTKVISLDAEGLVRKFETNDRCAAGTGRFLEVMARALGYPLEEFGDTERTESDVVQINSLCTVFAESEVVSLIAKGRKREDIAIAIHRSIAQRVLSMLKRLAVEKDIVFAGGCARNPCLRGILEKAIGNVLVAEVPEITGALGAALYAKDGL